MKTYPARYTDRFGTEPTTILDDGASLTMIVRGVRFRGRDFDVFEPEGVSDPALLKRFSFLRGGLCDCVIQANIPLPLATPTGAVDGLLTLELQVGQPQPTGHVEYERLTLHLAFSGQEYTSDGKTGWFEGEMVDLQGKLPPGTFMKACFGCAFADYSPYGHGLSGNMICFRTNKAGYLALPSGENFSKDAYFDVIDTVSEMVRETHLCPEFERRKPGTGYRG
jgi:hypothetical protein